jgi:hypothetical protein
VDELGSERKPQKSHITFLENRKVEFCFATALMALVQEVAGSIEKAGADILSRCLVMKPLHKAKANERSSRSEVHCHTSTIHRSTLTRHESLILRTCFELPFLKSLFDLLVYLLHSLRAIQRSVSDHERSIRFPFPPRI